MVTSASESGTRVSNLYPALAGVDLSYVGHDMDAVAAAAEIAFLAVPHTAAMSLAPVLLDAGVAVVDLSADFRLDDASVYEAWYGVSHEAPRLLTEAVYGLPEIDRTSLPGAPGSPAQAGRRRT
jgi:N-acetyl-gamma-glutamyl-phosphate reductase